MANFIMDSFPSEPSLAILVLERFDLLGATLALLTTFD